MRPVTWVVEPDAFPSAYSSFCATIGDLGHRIVRWNDDWWRSGRWPAIADQAVVFHGSLGNADRVRRELPWMPGAYCSTEKLSCSHWYPLASDWLLHRHWVITTVQALVSDPIGVAAPLGSPSEVFVRPDSPLKPFAGRVCPLSGLTARSLDFGFYYDDPQLQVVVAPTRRITREWRFVAVDGTIVAGSGYEPHGRHAKEGALAAPWSFAARVAASLPAPEAVYVLDVCESDGDLRLLELNPFSGADLYACDPADVVRAVSAVCSERGSA